MPNHLFFSLFLIILNLSSPGIPGEILVSSKLLINEHPLMLLPSLAVAVGLNEALLLQQIHYWLDPRMNKNYHKERFWVYNSYQEWCKQFPFWSERTLRRTIKSLEDQKVLTYEFLNKNSFDKTKWYTIDYDQLDTLMPQFSACGQNGQIDAAKMATSIYRTETTTETTTETNSRERIFPKQMIDVWNQSLSQDVKLTLVRAKRLQQVIATHFQTLKEWENFLSLILQSKFLRGEITNFKAGFDWAIKEENIQKILENTYSDSGVVETKEEKIEESEVDEFINSIEDETWKLVCKKVREKYGDGVVMSWFKDLKFVRTEEGCNIIAANKFIKNWVEERYGVFIRQSFAIREKKVWLQLL